jgi:hypothetical protein
MSKKVAWENKSPEGWWVAEIIERLEFEDEDTSNPRRRCRAWRNTVMVKARDRNDAYRKAIRYAQIGKDDPNPWIGEHAGRRVKCVFEGISSLLPVYDFLDEDGTEILYHDMKNITVRRVKSWVKRKEDLEVFDDLKRRPPSVRRRGKG